jgi:hypothetical protein
MFGQPKKPEPEAVELSSIGNAGVSGEIANTRISDHEKNELAKIEQKYQTEKIKAYQKTYDAISESIKASKKVATTFSSISARKFNAKEIHQHAERINQAVAEKADELKALALGEITSLPNSDSRQRAQKINEIEQSYVATLEKYRTSQLEQAAGKIAKRPLFLWPAWLFGNVNNRREKDYQKKLLQVNQQLRLEEFVVTLEKAEQCLPKRDEANPELMARNFKTFDELRDELADEQGAILIKLGERSANDNTDGINNPTFDVAMDRATAPSAAEIDMANKAMNTLLRKEKEEVAAVTAQIAALREKAGLPFESKPVAAAATVSASGVTEIKSAPISGKLLQKLHNLTEGQKKHIKNKLSEAISNNDMGQISRIFDFGEQDGNGDKSDKIYLLDFFENNAVTKQLITDARNIIKESSLDEDFEPDEGSKNALNKLFNKILNEGYRTLFGEKEAATFQILGLDKVIDQQKSPQAKEACRADIKIQLMAAFAQNVSSQLLNKPAGQEDDSAIKKRGLLMRYINNEKLHAHSGYIKNYIEQQEKPTPAAGEKPQNSSPGRSFGKGILKIVGGVIGAALVILSAPLFFPIFGIAYGTAYLANHSRWEDPYFVQPFKWMAAGARDIWNAVSTGNPPLPIAATIDGTPAQQAEKSAAPVSAPVTPSTNNNPRSAAETKEAKHLSTVNMSKALADDDKAEAMRQLKTFVAGQGAIKISNNNACTAASGPAPRARASSMPDSFDASAEAKVGSPSRRQSLTR